MRNLEHVSHIVVKIGSTSLCDYTGKLNKEKILKLIEQIAYVKRKGIKVTLVSSGAISAGMGVLHIDKKPRDMSAKQALAAIGQAHLMQIYEELFSLFELRCAQILLNHDDFDDRKRLMNLSNAMQAILDYDVIPIINENDTLAVDEIKVGDNDTLSSLILPIVDAQLLVLVSDIDGLYDDNPHDHPDAKLISDVNGVSDDIMNFAKDSNSQFGTGGMITKLKAAKVVNDYGGDMAIINGQVDHSLIDLLEGKEIGTYFNGRTGRILSSRNHWIMYRSSPKGKIVVDDGAKLALSRHTSLLPKGILEIEGAFMQGSVIDVMSLNNELLARGIVNYSSDEIRLIKGKNSSEIEDILHYKDYDEVIHANNLVLNKGE
ncbi:MAG: glutamate 5-kinase [Faecalibacillus sp.]